MKRVITLALSVLLLVSVIPISTAAAYDPIYVTDSNGITSTGDFDSLFSGQIIYYPASMMDSDDTYPVVVWANGTMCAPALYHSLLSKIAAGGYIVVTNTNMMSADGKAQIASVDFILEKNADPDSVFYRKVDTEHIAAAGHSQGGRSAVNAAAADGRIDCVLSIAGSNYTSEAKKLSTPTFFMAGGADMMVLASMWVKPAYKNCKGPAVYASLKGALHTRCCTNAGDYSGYAVAWFDAWLKDDADALDQFRSGGALSGDSKWKDFAAKGF
ncbi:MAG: dienelactone hydrolase family protein [Oscillospiraceae bacterium]|nr:dienelactone hydrolase family protein [Oscillospiraceae bacterium]